jgi:hypothetical protein
MTKDTLIQIKTHFEIKLENIKFNKGLQNVKNFKWNQKKTDLL